MTGGQRIERETPLRKSRGQGPWLRVSVAVLAFVALAVAAWFFLRGGPVTIRVEGPENYTLSLDGNELPPSEDATYTIVDGEHKVVVTARGYYPVERTFFPEKLPGRTLTISMEPLPGLVSFASEPAGAEVRVDGQLLGTTPLEGAELRPGNREVSFRFPNYLETTRVLDVEGFGSRQQLAVELTPDFIVVEIKGSVEARLFLDEAPQGRLPQTLRLPPGSYRFTATQPGYRPWRTRVDGEPGDRFSLGPPAWQLLDGTLALKSNPRGAAIFVDGRLRGNTPAELKLTADRSHQIRVSEEGYADFSFEQSIEPDQRVEKSVTLEPQYGFLRAVTEPPGATVTVDGAIKGRTPTTLRLLAVEHSVGLALEGYLPETFTQRIRNGRTAELKRTLTSQEAAATARISGEAWKELPPGIKAPNGYPMRLVPPGSFVMGTPPGTPDRGTDEHPAVVTISRAFYAGEHEVTNGELRAFWRDHNSGIVKGYSLNAEDRPAVNVSWEDAAKFANYLSGLAGLPLAYVEKDGELELVRPLNRGYRLPTEAEWEYMARLSGGKKDDPFPWGEAWPPPEDAGNFADWGSREVQPMVIEDYRDPFTMTAPVRKFPANALGLYEVAGNVAEWTSNWYEAAPPEQRHLTDPLGPETGTHRAIRGASWKDANKSKLRVSARRYENKGSEDVGFRLVRSVE